VIIFIKSNYNCQIKYQNLKLLYLCVNIVLKLDFIIPIWYNSKNYMKFILFSYILSLKGRFKTEG